MTHLTLEQLAPGMDHVRAAPAEVGNLELVVRRPAENERELLAEGRLDLGRGLVGDMWSSRPSQSRGDGLPNPDAQVTVMSARAAAIVAGSAEHAEWAQAGDQLYVDFDLSKLNLPPGARLAVGEAVLQVSELPHLGCGKFSRRFGVDALKLVNSDEGRELRLRGVNTRVVVPGAVRPGDRVTKL
jgi:hypothetical protein